MKCPFCGEEIPNGSAFCTKCGKQVETMVSVEDVKSVIPASSGAAPTEAPKAASSRAKSKGLLAPLITLATGIAGWIYILFSNTIEGLNAWLTSSDDLQNNLSDSYQYFGNNGGQDETTGYIVLLAVMAVLTVIAIVGLVWLCKRLLRKFGLKK